MHDDHCFFVALVRPHLKNGRTHLVTLAYSLAGEKDVDKLVARAVRGMLQDFMQATFTGPVAAAGVDSSSASDARDSGSSDAVLGCAAQTRIPFKLLDEIQVCADFSMLHWIHGMTGGSDIWRCVQRSGCDTLLLLRPRAHVERNENRTPEVLAEQWPLTVWTLASWSANHSRIPIQFCSGTACVACPDCNNLLPVSEGDAFTTGVVHCSREGCREERAPVHVLHPISKTALARPSTLLARPVAACVATHCCAACRAACSCQSCTVPGHRPRY